MMEPMALTKAVLQEVMTMGKIFRSVRINNSKIKITRKKCSPSSHSLHDLYFYLEDEGNGIHAHVAPFQKTIFFFNFLIFIVGVESKLGPLGTSATHWPIVPAPGDCEDGEFGGMNGRGNRSIRRKPAPTPLCPPQILLDQTRD
jgi:hypothetical protein